MRISFCMLGDVKHGPLLLAAAANIVDATVYNQNARGVFIFAPQFCK